MNFNHICFFHVTTRTKYHFVKMSVQITFNEIHSNVDVSWLKSRQTIIPPNIFKTPLKDQFLLF